MINYSFEHYIDLEIWLLGWLKLFLEFFFYFSTKCHQNSSVSVTLIFIVNLVNKKKINEIIVPHLFCTVKMMIVNDYFKNVFVYQMHLAHPHQISPILSSPLVVKAVEVLQCIPVYRAIQPVMHTVLFSAMDLIGQKPTILVSKVHNKIYL